MEGFSWWWIIWGVFEIFVGICVGLIMLVVMKRKGSIALFMVPLAAWQILWSSWNAPRSDWLWEWLMNNEFSPDWYPTSFLVGAFISWILVFLALIPAMAKDKSSSDSPSKPATAASPSDAYAKLSEE